LGEVQQYVPEEGPHDDIQFVSVDSSAPTDFAYDSFSEDMSDYEDNSEDMSDYEDNALLESAPPSQASDAIVNNDYCTKYDLVKWAIDFDIRCRARNEILRIIRNFDPQELRNLPKDFRTLSGEPLNPSIKDLGSHQLLVYFGISQILNNKGVYTSMLNTLDELGSNALEMTLNVDGLPLFKSSRNEFWPLLGRICGTVFLIGYYFGPGKPTEMNLILEDLVEDIIRLQEHEVVVNGRLFTFRLKLISADAPACSSLLKIKESLWVLQLYQM